MADLFKQALRSTLKNVRKRLSTHYQQSASIKVYNNLRKLDAYRYAKHIALYYASNGEIDLSNLWQAAPLQGKYCYFPALNNQESLSFLPATPVTPFHKNFFGILEPDVDLAQAVNPGKLDIILLPLLAFDIYGTRLGMGKGYYDRTLAGQDYPLMVGIAYDFQRQVYLPRENWDVPMHFIITPSTIYRSKE